MDFIFKCANDACALHSRYIHYLADAVDAVSAILQNVARLGCMYVCWKIASHIRDNPIGIISRQCGLFGFLPTEISPCAARETV